MKKFHFCLYFLEKQRLLATRFHFLKKFIFQTCWSLENLKTPPGYEKLLSTISTGCKHRDFHDALFYWWSLSLNAPWVCKYLCHCDVKPSNRPEPVWPVTRLLCSWPLWHHGKESLYRKVLCRRTVSKLTSSFSLFSHTHTQSEKPQSCFLFQQLDRCWFSVPPVAGWKTSEPEFPWAKTPFYWFQIKVTRLPLCWCIQGQSDISYCSAG